MLHLPGVALWGPRAQTLVHAFAACHSLELVDLSAAAVSSAAAEWLREAQAQLPCHLLLDVAVSKI